MNKERELAEKDSTEMKEETMKSSLENEDAHLDQQEEHDDVTSHTKEGLLKLIQEFKLTDSISRDNSFLKEIKNHYDQLLENERDQALHKFIEDGGVEDDFDYKKDKTSQSFEKIYETLKAKISQNFSNQEKEKEKNLQIKNELLERLRQLTSAEETKTSIVTLKEIQDQWRSTGPVPPNQAHTLWANYNALVEMFYNNRTIYFELKELDRKKNLEAKKELCDKVEALTDNPNILQAVRDLRTLHDEFKHIGPVPKEDQEGLWNRFKTASDKIYEKRKEYYNNIKNDLEENLTKKLELIQKIEAFGDFSTDKIDDWKAKTKEVIDIQEDWKKIGRVPKDKAKESSKKFWSACKAFFNHKNVFFKQLESQKEDNLKKKIEFCEQAEALKDSDDFKNTAQALKDLQKQWESVGPVPIKKKEEVFKRFKAACDAFFNKKREQHAEVEKEFVENLRMKISILEKIEKLAESEIKDSQELKTLQQEWKNIGFVPRAEVKNINERYNNAIEKYIAGLESLNKDEKDDLKIALQLAAIKGSPTADKKLHRKESEIHKRISSLRKEINQYNTNIDFLARSSKADKLRDEINSRIQHAENELKTLEDQLKLIKDA